MAYAKDPRSSSFYDAKVAITKFQAIVPVEKENGQIEQRVDMLDPKMMRLVKSIQRHSYVRYDGITHITTYAQRAYGKTTAWWIIMMYNGFVHPLEIEPGTMLKIPSREDVDALIEAASAPAYYEPGSRTVTI